MGGLAGYQGEALLIANPISGWGKVARHLKEVADALRALGLELSVCETGGPGDARKAAGEFGGGLILSFGGDGTFNEVLNGADPERAVLGVIPAGTGNVLAKELRVPRCPRRAVRALAGGRIVRYDMGVCNDRRFACVFGAGLDAHIVQLVHEARGGNLTQLHYVPVLLRSALRAEPWEIEVRLDGERLADGMNIVCAGNSRSYGGPIEMTPAASPTDGRLDVMASRVGGPLDIWGPGMAALGRALHVSGSALYGRGVEVEVRSPRDDVPWEVDGDLGGRLPAHVRCEPGRVRMVASREFRPRARGFRGGPDQ